MEIRPATWWKLLGAAGIVGVAATGVLAARKERARRAYTPDEIRTRLMERYVLAERAEAQREVRLQAADAPPAPAPRVSPGVSPASLWSALRRSVPTWLRRRPDPSGDL